MVLLILALLFIAGGGIWLWKGPLSKSARSLRESGSSRSEAYGIIVFVLLVCAAALYFFSRIGGS